MESCPLRWCIVVALHVKLLNSCNTSALQTILVDQKSSKLLLIFSNLICNIHSIYINHNILNQYTELLTIDWIMETRLSLWEMEYGNFDNNDYYNFVPVESSILTRFQDDLNLLRCLTADIPVGIAKISFSLLFNNFFSFE